MSSTRSPHARTLPYEYVAAVLHDLRNPLGATTGNLLYIREGYGPEGLVQPAISDVVEALDDATDAVRRIETLVDEMASVAQHGAGTLRVQKEPFDLSALLQQCASDAKREAELRGLELTIAPCEQVLVSADRTLTRRLVNSLLWNAFRSLPSSGKVEVATRREPKDAGFGATLLLSHTAPLAPGAEHELEREPGIYFAQCMLEAHRGILRIDRTATNWPTTILATWPPDLSDHESL